MMCTTQYQQRPTVACAYTNIPQTVEFNDPDSTNKKVEEGITTIDGLLQNGDKAREFSQQQEVINDLIPPPKRQVFTKL